MKPGASSSTPRLVPLPRSFFEPSAAVVAPELLGHFLVRRTPATICGGVIVETEAYVVADPSCHGYRGPTPRNRVMFGPPGYSYVYFIYGNYYCFNTVCCPAGTAEAVLVRAVEPRLGVAQMRARRVVEEPRELTSGPAKLCLAMNIGREMNGADLCSTESPLFVACNAERERLLRVRGPVITTTRVGISQPAAVEMPLRFYLDGSEFVSRRAAKALIR